MKRIYVLGMFLALAAVPGVSMAAPLHPGPYFSGFLGVNIPYHSDSTTYDYSSGTTFNDQIEFDPGVYVGGTGGYDFGFLRLEGEISFRHFPIGGLETTSPSYQKYFSVDGDMTATSFLVNAFTDFHNRGPVTPYIGGGIGFSEIHISDTDGTTSVGQVTRQRIYDSDDASVFAYQVGAGMGIALNRMLTLDIGYRYFGTSTAHFDNMWAARTEMKLNSHNVAVGLRFKF